MGKAVYLSHFLDSDTPQYGGEGKGIGVTLRKQMINGDSCNTQEWNLSNHLGTHIDLPRHFMRDGKMVGDYAPDFWICAHTVLVDIPLGGGRLLMPEDLPGKVEKNTDCLLLRTGFEAARHEYRYVKDNPGISPQLCEWLFKNCPNLKFLGMDFISVARYCDKEEGRAAHRLLLGGAGGVYPPILPVEDMRLSPLVAGDRVARLFIAPVPVAGADGAPVMVVAELQ